MKEQGCLLSVSPPTSSALTALQTQDHATVEHRSHKGLTNLVENSHVPQRKRERFMQRFRSPGALHGFVSVFSAFRNLFAPAYAQPLMSPSIA
nr:DDE-type integrase/transposase/recombinase [Rhizobium etli]